MIIGEFSVKGRLLLHLDKFEYMLIDKGWAYGQQKIKDEQNMEILN